ncbi:hypothetical protein A1O3_06165 [Capronia epimyces CBS 606.96]|uniref:Uncharacterized protein n=1 Tax=Capronia epimyces CBS 606.96 TaxID=1182542 RepID=W9XPB6_9EURO|nr:uncharacterized protein A1O3_06165 [Capronia epimyces CBS 606.96]EXJ82352.1 hypothetical protein A1O3_06165 [Capronia epimyces CBS 606.96]
MDRVSVIATLISGFLPGWVHRLARHAQSVPLESDPVAVPAPAPAPLIVHLSDESVAKIQGAIEAALNKSLAPVKAKQAEILEAFNRLGRINAERSFTVSLHGEVVRDAN